MSIARRFLTGFRQTETNEPGLELNEDGTVDLVNPDGSRTALPGGSSPSVKWVDLGVVDVTSVFTNGPQTLYTLQAGEALAAIRFLDDHYVAPNLNVGVPGLTFGFGTPISFGWYGFANITPGAAPIVLDTGGTYANNAAVSPALGAAGAYSMALATSGPVQAAWFFGDANGAGGRASGVTGWQAATAYADFSAAAPGDLSALRRQVVENGTVWYNVGASGTSGLAKPDFAGNAGGNVNDGADIVWTDSTFPPNTTGLIHPVAEIVTPT